MFSPVEWLGLILLVTFNYLPAIIAASFVHNRSQYKAMKKTLNVPPWAFGVIWTFVYFMLGVAAFLFWQTGIDGNTPPIYHAGMALMVVHVFFNALWCPAFFGMGWIAIALGDLIICLIIAAVSCILFFFQSIAAGCLLIPVIIWYLFAGYLNADSWYHNGWRITTPGERHQAL